MKQISTQNRNTIRKCVKNGLFVKVTDDYSSFTDIYNETMRKVNADDFYSFSSDYFETFKNDIQSILMGVFKDNKMIASAIFMEYGEYFHYHLSGSRKDSLHLAPNNILLWEAIKYAKEHGYKKMHFGGGMSDSTDDSLFRFKSHFSKEYYDFYIGKRVHNKDIYNELISRWENKSNRKASMLLQYRM
jgi:lipid II:glycine glycyltransferase (peptidoglycan interpeptide bridge formation enzyme)